MQTNQIAYFSDYRNLNPNRDAQSVLVWSKVHDEGVQIVENLANIRVPLTLRPAWW
jgi:hypothetical protein